MRYQLSQKNTEHCKHNINYWQFGDYLGVGAGAHGKITLPDKNIIIRTTKTRQPQHYINHTVSALGANKQIAENQLALEFMMNALRLTHGVTVDLFSLRTGLTPDQIKPEIDRLKQEGFLRKLSSEYCTTDLGMRFLDTILQRFS